MLSTDLPMPWSARAGRAGMEAFTNSNCCGNSVSQTNKPFRRVKLSEDLRIALLIRYS